MQLQVVSQINTLPVQLIVPKRPAYTHIQPEFIRTTCKGDRFHPMISHGDALLVQEYTDNDFMPGDVYLVIGPNGSFNSLCYIGEGSTPDKVLLSCPNNEKHPDREIALNKLEGIFWVKKVLKELCW